MAPTVALTLYCGRDELERELSADGVNWRLDDDGNGTVSAAEELALTDALRDASETINYYLYHRYTPGNLANSWWVNRRATILAAYALCQRRGNPAPESLVDRADKAIAELEQCTASRNGLPGVPQRQLPLTWSNLRADPRFNWRVIRVERGTSSLPCTPVPGHPAQAPDWREAWNYEL